MSKKLTEIRNDILKAVQAGDELGAKFAINDLDTYITKQNRVKSDSISDVMVCFEYAFKIIDDYAYQAAVNNSNKRNALTMVQRKDISLIEINKLSVKNEP
jgi:hypothetical protein